MEKRDPPVDPINPKHSMGLPNMPISWGGARGVNGAAVLWQSHGVSGKSDHPKREGRPTGPKSKRTRPGLGLRRPLTGSDSGPVVQRSLWVFKHD